jgi:hypothetical protein
MTALKSNRDLTGIAADAERIRTAAQKMPLLFPDGSTDEHSEALFSSAANNLRNGSCSLT